MSLVPNKRICDCRMKIQYYLDGKLLHELSNVNMNTTKMLDKTIYDIDGKEYQLDSIVYKSQNP